MGGVLSGFAVIGALVLVGFVLARRSVLGDNGREVLPLLAFYVASPALLFELMSRADLGILVSTPLLVFALSTICCGAVFALIGLARRWGVGPTTIGALCASNVNSANLGIPIAVYVLGDATLVAPIILFQSIVYIPIALTVLDVSRSRSGRPSLVSVIVTPFRNPLIIAAVIGGLFSTFHWTLWQPMADAVHLLAGMAVPAMLLAYGMSLFGTTIPGSGDEGSMVWTAVGLKALVQPILAWVLGAFVFHFDNKTLLAVVILAALPAAQNSYTYAWLYNAGTVLARDAILISTMLAPLTLTAAAALLS